MNDSNLIQPNKAPGLLRPSPAASSRLRDGRGDGAGPPGAAGAGDIASAGHSSSQDDLVPLPARTPDVDVAVSHASALSSSPSKRDPPPAASPKGNLSTSQSASFSAMDAKPASLTAASASAFSGEQTPRRGLNDPATSAMRTAVDCPVSQPLSPEKQSNGSAPRLASSPSKTATASRLELVPGQKRTATGEIKPAAPSTMSQVPATNGAIHARKMSADSRIAELSAQLRARLSYAAAKVEKSWQTRQGEGDRRRYNGSPEGTTVSAPDSFRHDSSRASNPVTSTAPSSSSYRPQTSRSSLPPPQTTPLHTQQAPKLAPPADIVASGGSSARRRPNPNATDATTEYNPYPRHRRHYSEQQARASRPDTTAIPGTPPSSLPASTPSAMGNLPTIKHRTPSQNALMEQDAIETLLFMSSPENSGYHSSSQSRQTNVSMSIEAQMGSTQSSQSSNASNGSHAQLTQKGGFVGNAPVSSGQPIGPEAQAGDEIDRMLNQMRRASEGETRLSSYDYSIDSWKH